MIGSLLSTWQTRSNRYAIDHPHEVDLRFHHEGLPWPTPFLTTTQQLTDIPAA
ncbi:hypothetical protein RRSWK_04679 [Rhodopirellula sp. SWK7]|nr:hypothetical protein RRSWK_04679 [Rhodopirellula sp. SWK7]